MRVEEMKNPISKMKAFTTLLTIAVAFASMTVVAIAAEVVQGKCVAIDEVNKTYIIEVYDTTKSKEHPHGRSTNKIFVINYSKALVGKDPEVGDIIRAAYRIEGTENMAIRVMNITKQDIMRK